VLKSNRNFVAHALAKGFKRSSAISLLRKETIMLLKQARINGIRITIMEGRKFGAKNYTITKYKLDGTIAEKVESRFSEMAHHAFNEMCNSENKNFSNEIRQTALDVKSAIR
jgi:hypothetical protein